jgi:hypothetical protein
LDVEKEVETYENIIDDEEVLVVGIMNIILPEIEEEKESDKFKTSKRRSMKDKYLKMDYDKHMESRKKLKEKSEKITRKNFVMNEAKLKKKRRIIAEKKKGKGVPKNLK